MGYGYDSRNRLCCDQCGNAGGVRKRRCPHKVLGDSLRSPSRFAMDYCSAPALCGPCFSAEGGTRGVHERCAAPAAASQAEYDATQARLDAGEWHVVSASGDWHPDVPAGQVQITFWTAGGPPSGQRTVLVPADVYDPAAKPWLSDYQPISA
jgi:hypothetical protein